MRIIRILLTKPKNYKFPIFSHLIRFFEKTSYSHILINWHSESLQREIYYEATGRGVNFLSSSLIFNKYEIIKEFEFKITPFMLKNVATFCHDNAGKNYGIKQIFGLILIRIAKVFGFKIANPFRDGSYSQICIETGFLVLREAGISVLLKDNIEDIGLAEFEDVLDRVKKVYGKNNI